MTKWFEGLLDARSAQGKVVSVILAATLTLMVWDARAMRQAFADEVDEVAVEQVEAEQADDEQAVEAEPAEEAAEPQADEQAEQAADEAAEPALDAEVATPEVVEQVAEDAQVADKPAPEATYTGSANGIDVTAVVPAGEAIASMKVTAVPAAQVVDDVNAAIEGKVAAADIAAVDIAFADAEGTEVEPSAAVRVTLRSAAIAAADEPAVVHIPDAGQPEVVTTTAPAADQLAFASDDFSIYVVVGQGETENTEARAEIQFYVNEKMVQSQIVKKSDFTGGNGEQLNPIAEPGLAESDLTDHEKFYGWIIENDPTMDATGTRQLARPIDGVNNWFRSSATFSEDKTNPTVYKVKADIAVTYYVTYGNEQNAVIQTDEVRAGSDYTVNMQYTPEPETDAGGKITAKTMLDSWHIVTGGEEGGVTTFETKDGVQVDRAANGTAIKVDRDMAFTPIIARGFWITYHPCDNSEELAEAEAKKEDTSGIVVDSAASYTAPYFAKFETAIPQTTPTRAGYTFDGWYTAKDGGTKYTNFGIATSLTSDLELYAHWTEAAPTYRVVYWKQKATDEAGLPDSKKTYDYAGMSEARTAANPANPTASLTDVDTTKAQKTIETTGWNGWTSSSKKQ